MASKTTGWPAICDGCLDSRVRLAIDFSVGEYEVVQGLALLRWGEDEIAAA